jgi:3-oxoadipate enol-lactonase
MPSLPATTQQRVLESGESTQSTIVLIHSLGTGAWMWRPQLSVLGSHFHTLALDLPGFGTASSDGPFSMEKAAQAVLALVRAGGKDGAHICGLSLGATVALQAYLTEPGLVKSLVLSGGQVHPNRLRGLVQRVIVSLLPERSLVGSILQETGQQHPELVEEATAWTGQLRKRDVLMAMRALASTDLRSLLPRVAVPTLVVCGANDAPHLPAARLMAATIPHAELLIIPGAGHVWNLEQPELFGRTVLTFVERVDAQGS